MQMLRRHFLRYDADGDAFEEARGGEVQGHGEPHGQRHEIESHMRLRGDIVEDRVRLEDENLHGGHGNPGIVDAFRKGLDR